MKIFPKTSFENIINEFELATQLINESGIISDDSEILVGNLYCSDTTQESNLTDLGSTLDLVTIGIDLRGSIFEGIGGSTLDLVTIGIDLRGSIFEGIGGLASSKSLEIKVENEALRLYEILNNLIYSVTLRNMLIPFKVGVYPVALVFKNVLFEGFSDIGIEENDPLSECLVTINVRPDSKVYMKRVSSLDSVEEFESILSSEI